VANFAAVKTIAVAGLLQNNYGSSNGIAQEFRFGADLPIIGWATGGVNPNQQAAETRTW